MATPARVKGMVLTTERRNGTSAKTGNAYDFTVVNVLVGVRGTIEFTAHASTGQVFASGELVDVVVDLSVYAGRLQATAIGPWTTADENGLAAA